MIYSIAALMVGERERDSPEEIESDNYSLSLVNNVVKVVEDYEKYVQLTRTINALLLPQFPVVTSHSTTGNHCHTRVR